MNKYIPADKLIAEIERRRLSNRYIDTEDYEKELLEIITSLLQEQPEVDLDAEIAIYLNRNVLNRINNSDIIEDFTTIEAGELARHFCRVGKDIMKERAIAWFENNWREYIIGPDSDGCIGLAFWKNAFRKDMED